MRKPRWKRQGVIFDETATAYMRDKGGFFSLEITFGLKKAFPGKEARRKK
jgi:hypothetical protein